MCTVWCKVKENHIYILAHKQTHIHEHIYPYAHFTFNSIANGIENSLRNGTEKKEKKETHVSKYHTKAFLLFLQITDPFWNVIHLFSNRYLILHGLGCRMLNALFSRNFLLTASNSSSLQKPANCLCHFYSPFEAISFVFLSSLYPLF